MTFCEMTEGTISLRPEQYSAEFVLRDVDLDQLACYMTVRTS
jgi:hypothetical protein